MPTHLDLPAAGSPEATRHLNRGLVALQDALRTPGLEALEPGDPLPQELLDAIARWLDAYDAYIRTATQDLTVTCGMGCHACCAHGPDGVAGVEALLALRAARALPDGEAVLARMAEQAARFEERVDRTGSTRAAATETGLQPDPCAFLDRLGRCRIYAARPVACRMFVSITDPAWCDHRHPQHDQAVNPHLLPPTILRRILAAISERLGLLDLPPDLWRAVTAADARWPAVEEAAPPPAKESP